MARPKSVQPAYQFHVSGQGRVTLDGQDFYLGLHGTPESYARYYALLAEHKANGQKAPSGPRRLAQNDTPEAGPFIRVRDVVADFRAKALPYHESNLGQHNRFSNLCDLLDQRHGDEPANDFGPRKLESLRDHIATNGVGEKGKPGSRVSCNTMTRLVIRIFAHGVAREIAKPDRIIALESLPALKLVQGRETTPRTGADINLVKATLPHLSKTMRAMVALQVATAMRPSELFRMTPTMIDRSQADRFYRPTKHKTSHKGKAKALPIIGEVRAVLTPYLFRDQDEPCFITTK